MGRPSSSGENPPDSAIGWAMFKRCAMIDNAPIQLDLFIPYEYEYEFKVIVTNKWALGKKIRMYHNGRAALKSVLGELKSQSQMDYIAVRGLLGNQLSTRGSNEQESERKVGFADVAGRSRSHMFRLS